ncbi:MAG TPA: sulfur carrier protein ThiS [Candidatus Eremiobacteraceae bacterium]|nr:sulfur carrier protein ThiS [Candidatus Eremiobacteraceae bacterium]
MEATFTANGKARTATPGMTVADLLASANLTPLQVFVEYNGEPLPRERFAATPIEAGDRIEIAQMVGGG